VNLTQPAELKALLLRHGLSPTKKWGQHFLISPPVVEAILHECREAASALEVGPGPGVLTRGMTAFGIPVTAVEVDSIAVSALGESAPDARVIAGDALRVDLREIIGDLPAPRVLVSNMPYNITGPLLDRFSQIRDQYAKAILMMQREVGDKILAQEGDSGSGSLSICMQAMFEISRVALAPAGAFFPPPRVDSIVLRFIPRAESPDAEFLAFVRRGFTQPRKTLTNNLHADRIAVAEALAAMGRPVTSRPHELGLGAWQELYRRVRG